MKTPESSDKPDAEQYARVILWHLCTLQATLTYAQVDVIQKAGDEAGAAEADVLDSIKARGKQIRSKAEGFYSEALLQANIKPSPNFPPLMP